MDYKLSSGCETEEEDVQQPQTSEKFLDLLYGEFQGDDNFGNCIATQIEQVLEDTCAEKKQPPTKKRTRASSEKVKSKKKGSTKMKTNTIDLGQSSDEEGGNKRGPNWKEHWIVNLIHLRGKMHDKFTSMKKQGVDNWGLFHTHLVVACHDFDRSSDACRKKWKKLYDDYKADYNVNGISGSQRSSKSKYYHIIDSYMHDRANVFKHVYGSATDENPNQNPFSLLHEGEDVPETLKPLEASSSEVQGKKKTDKLAAQQAMSVIAEQSVRLTNAIASSEAAKLNLLQGMLATMNKLVRKL